MPTTLDSLEASLTALQDQVASLHAEHLVSKADHVALQTLTAANYNSLSEALTTAHALINSLMFQTDAAATAVHVLADTLGVGWQYKFLTAGITEISDLVEGHSQTGWEIVHCYPLERGIMVVMKKKMV